MERRLPVRSIAKPHDVGPKARREGDIEGSQLVGTMIWGVDQRWWCKPLWSIPDVHPLQHDLISRRREIAALPQETMAVDPPRNTSAAFGMEVFNKLSDCKVISP